MCFWNYSQIKTSEHPKNEQNESSILFIEGENLVEKMRMNVERLELSERCFVKDEIKNFKGSQRVEDS